MSRVVVLGNATLDLIQRVPSLPRPGETLLSGPVQHCAGGKGLNQAVAAARTGATVVLVAAIGQDSNAAFLKNVLNDEIGLEVQWQVCESATDVSSIWVSADGENMILSTAECARSLTPQDAQTVAAGLERGDLLLMQGNLSADTTVEAARTARAQGAIAVLNTAPIAWDLQLVLGMFDCVIANEVEAAMIAGGDAAHFWPTLEALDVTTAILTIGARGAHLFSGNADVIIPPPWNHASRGGVVDTAGAGDVMVGTFVGFTAQGWSFQHAASIAVAAASLSVTRHGTLPSFPTREEIAELKVSNGAVKGL
jgi:ribokinase